MIQYKKEHGYPVNLEIKTERDWEWVDVSIFINGEEQIFEAFDTKCPIETRKAWARGFFAGYEYAKKEMV